MAEKLKNSFVGTGPLQQFVEEANKLFTAINNASVVMPAGYTGIPPSIRIENGSLTLDFGDALIFTERGIAWNIQAPNSTIIENSAVIKNGQLELVVRIDDSPYTSEQWNFYGDYVDKITGYSASITNKVLTVNVDTEFI